MGFSGTKTKPNVGFKRILFLNYNPQNAVDRGKEIGRKEKYGEPVIASEQFAVAACDSPSKREARASRKECSRALTHSPTKAINRTCRHSSWMRSQKGGGEIIYIIFAAGVFGLLGTAVFTGESPLKGGGETATNLLDSINQANQQANSDSKASDQSAAILCGNGVIDSPEGCDGSNLNGATCDDFDYPGGTLSCNSNCTFNFSACNDPAVCGDGICQVKENSTSCSQDCSVAGSVASSAVQPMGPTSFRVFVTSQSYKGNLGGLNGADAKCQTLADSTGLNGTFKAYLGDWNINSGQTAGSFNPSISNRLYHSPVPYVRLDGALVANDWNDLIDRSIVTQISIDENYRPVTSNNPIEVWTA